jgi:S1-C subfamily serine protease
MVNGGNSGGPVVALESGKVVGVVINALTQVQKNPGPPDFTPGGPDVELEVPTGIGRGIYIHMAEPAILDLRKS